MKALTAKIFSVMTFGLMALNASSSVYIYNNSVNDPAHRLSAPENVWFGDEVILGNTYSDRFMSGFDFQYWAVGTSGLTVDIELRLNNGAVIDPDTTAPGTLVYGFYGYDGPSNTGVPNTGRNTISISAADLDAYDGVINGGTQLNFDHVTLALRFHNLGSGTAGVDLYNPPVEGSGYLDYWQFDGSNWQLTTNNTFGTVNFAMTVSVVPEPSVFSIFLMAGMMAVGFRRFFGKK